MEEFNKISVSWVKKSEILLWKYEPFWDWLSFQRAVVLSRQMMASTHKPVVELMDFSESGHLPPDVLTEARQIFRMSVPKNLSMVVCYGFDGYAHSTYRVLTYIMPLIYITTWNIKTADDFDSAYKLAYEHLYGNVKRDYV